MKIFSGRVPLKSNSALLCSLTDSLHHHCCRLQKQMKIMNRNLTGKLEEMNGMQNVDTHVALSGAVAVAVCSVQCEVYTAHCAVYTQGVKKNL